MTDERVSPGLLHEPEVKGEHPSCWVICRGCGFEGAERPTEYVPGVLKLATTKENAGRIVRDHRKQFTSNTRAAALPEEGK